MRLAVIGMGFMGSTHLKALRSIPGAEVVAVCRRDESKFAGDLETIQGNLGGPGERIDFTNVAKYCDVRTAIEDQRVEAVDICLPTHLHAPVAIQALEAGKHVLVEKPMALDPASARDMIRAAKSSGRVLMVAHVLRFMTAYEALRCLLHSGRIGCVRSAMFRRRCAAPGWSAWLGDPQLSGGSVLDLLIHDLDMCLYLLGKPLTISASGYEAPRSGVDIITAELSYPGGCSAIITGGWHNRGTYPFSMEYTVVADGGTVEYNSCGRAPAFYRADGVAEKLPVKGTDGYRAEIEYFLDCCRHGKNPDLCTPESSAEAVAFSRIMLDARSKNGEKISCQL